jgi:hypothetical protein
MADNDIQPDGAGPSNKTGRRVPLALFQGATPNSTSA